MAEEYSISQLTEDTTAHDSDLIEISKDNGDGTYTSRKQTRETLLEGTATQSELQAHESDTTNPHNVTKSQVGLGNVDNTSDASKPISTAVQSALNGKANTVHTHDDRYYTESETNTLLSAKADTTDLHSHANKPVLDATTASFTTADETKLDGIADQATKNETDAHLKNRANHTGTQTASTISDFTTAADARITAQKGQNNGLASLDSSGKVPSTQLPSYVDDVVEATSFGTLPGTGTAGIIYVTIDTNKTYRWSGSAYVEISPSPGSTDAIPEGSTNKYFTDSRVSANSDVAANTAARHTHSNKSVLDSTTASFTADDETKLDGIASGATANSTDATLLNRSNHTGTQAISSVAGLQSALDGKADDGHAHIVSDVTGLQTALDTKADVDDIPTLPDTIVESIVAGTNVTIDNSDPANPVISSTGGGGGGGAVDSVNGQTGVVVLDADDIDDESTSHKFATATQLANADSAVQPDDLATVATSGDYTDLSNPPTIPDSLTDLDTTVTGTQLNDLKTKVDEIEAGAQVNDVSAADIADFETTTQLDSRDTANRNRANHTGTQAISTVTGLQTALESKAASVHTHDITDVTNLQTSLDGKAPTSHTHDITEILNLGSAAGDETDDFAPAEHTHAQSDITNLTSDLADKQDTLVSGTNIKTINGSSLLGSGDLTVSGGGGGGATHEQDFFDYHFKFDAVTSTNGGRLNALGGGATASMHGTDGLVLQLGTGGTDSISYSSLTPRTALYPIFDKHFVGKFGVGALPNNTNYSLHFLFGGGRSLEVFGKTVGFVQYKEAGFYATSHNGSASTRTDISASLTRGSTQLSQNLAAIHDPGASDTFYGSDGAELVVHTTNVPSGTASAQFENFMNFWFSRNGTSGGSNDRIIPDYMSIRITK